MSLLLHVAVCLSLPLIIAVLSGSLLNQGIILKDVDDKFKGTIIILKDEKCNAKAVLGPMSQLRMLDPSEDVLVVDKDNDDIDFDKIIEAQVVNKTLDTFELVPADAQVALNGALEPISAFEERLKAGRIFDLNSPIESHPFTKSVFYQWPRGNHARVIKEPSANGRVGIMPESSRSPPQRARMFVRCSHCAWVQRFK